MAYNDILVSSCAKYGIAAFTGDGVDSNVMVAATKAIKKTDGNRNPDCETMESGCDCREDGDGT